VLRRTGMEKVTVAVRGAEGSGGAALPDGAPFRTVGLS
jgi:hypothetical protein